MEQSTARGAGATLPFRMRVWPEANSVGIDESVGLIGGIAAKLLRPSVRVRRPFGQAARDKLCSMRSLAELVDVAESAWPATEAAVEAAGDGAVALPVDRRDAEVCLWRLQVTVGSVLGALALHTGGLVIDHGWLRVLGGGSGALPDLATVNGLGDVPPAAPLEKLVVAFDAVGGRFAVNGGGLPGPMGEVHYFAPDTLAWEPLGAGHGSFVRWALEGGIGAFAESLRWPGWQVEVSQLDLDRGISFYPPLFAGGARDRSAASRRSVPLAELHGWLDEVSTQLPTEGSFRLNIVD